MSGLGSNFNELKARIQKAQEDLAQISEPESPLAEVINMTNLLRANEHLARTGEKKTALISVYGDYVKQLEQIVSSLLSLQADLRDIRKEASVTGAKKPRRKKAKTKTKKRKK